MKRKALLVLGLSVALTCTNVVSVYAAEGENYSIETYSSNNSKVEATGDTETTVDGDVSVTGDNETAVKTTDNAKVSVKGDVSVEGSITTGVMSKDNSSVKVNGDVTAEGYGTSGISAGKKSNVMVNGTVEANGAGATGIKSMGETTAGNVLVKGSDSAGVLAAYGGKVTINNDVKVVESDRRKDSAPVSGVGTEKNGSVNVKGNIEVNGVDAMGILLSSTLCAPNHSYISQIK